MAITRAQQFRQMLIKGGVANPDGRRGFFKGALDDARDKNEPISPGTSVGGNTRGGTGKGRDLDVQQRGMTKAEYNRRVAEGTIDRYRGSDDPPKPPQLQQDKRFIPTPVPTGISAIERFRNDQIQKAVNRNRVLALRKLGLMKKPSISPVGQILESFEPIPEEFELMSYDDLVKIATTGPYLSQQKTVGDVNRFTSGKDLLGRTFEAEDLLRTGEMTQDKFEELFPGPTPIPDDRGPSQQEQELDPCKGPNPPAYCFVGEKAKETIEAQRNLGGLPARITGSVFDFTDMADGGRVGAQEGGIMPRLNELSGNVSSAEQMLQDINQRLESAESSLGEGGGDTPLVQTPPSLYMNKPLEAIVDPSAKPQQLQQADPNSPFVLGVFQSRPENTAGPMAQIPASGSQFSQVTPPQTPVAMQTPLSGIPAASYASGGPVGGVMDLETGRQMYFLGKLVKKATRAVKKITKSPLGKAAILGGLAYFGGTGGGGFTNLLKKGFLKDTAGKFALENLSPLKTIGIVSALSGLMASQEDEEKITDRGPELSMEELIAIRNNPFATTAPRFAGSTFAFAADGGRIGYQEGSKEPVAKKTMPLLDMGGQEMDLRENGGFVPIGRMEKADDVPARLSKNEFVFTADAVRNAGDGDVDKGSEVMYNMMKNLESGGEVSEESQGLDGARKMFQTSKRLEEVI